MNKKRWALLLIAAVLLTVGVVAIHNVIAQRAAKKRQTAYQSTVMEYSATMKPGMTRQQVESFLHANGLRFKQMCCVTATHSAYADLVMIGKEKAPWYCSENNVYVAFEFETTEPHGIVADSRSSDRLTNVALFPRLEDCL